jgi:hypothetical protein
MEMNAQRIWQGWQSDEGGWKTLVLIILWGAFFAVVLTGCATSAVRDRIVEVSKPVAVHPITAAQIPAVPAPLGPRPSSLSAAADLLLSKHCEWVAYALRADPLLRLSAGEPQKALQAYPECQR